MIDLEYCLERYLQKGFGSMNKNDFEVFIFGRLLNTKLRGLGDYEISRVLQIPQTKVKRLRYEADLKEGGRDYKTMFESIIRQAKLRSGGEQILFSVEDLSLRRYLDSILKSDGRFSDSSFNSEIVSVNLEDFVFLCETVLKGQDFDAIIAHGKELLKGNENCSKRMIFKGVLKKYIESVATEAGKYTVNLSLPLIVTWLKGAM